MLVVWKTSVGVEGLASNALWIALTQRAGFSCPVFSWRLSPELSVSRVAAAVGRFVSLFS
jgi:hypothetical protein